MVKDSYVKKSDIFNESSAFTCPGKIRMIRVKGM
jgi:hypothetical protein